MKFTFWKKKTIVEILNQHLALLTHAEKVEHLKAIIPMVCPGTHLSLNPPTGIKKARKPQESNQKS